MIDEWIRAKEAIETLASRWLEILRPAYEAAMQAVRDLYNCFWRAYLEAGAPYGETDEGMWRWARECAEAERLRREAEDIELYHRQMVSFRKMLAERERK